MYAGRKGLLALPIHLLEVQHVQGNIGLRPVGDDHALGATSAREDVAISISLKRPSKNGLLKAA